MSRLPASHNDSFARLLAEGYVLYRRGAYVVGRVPFLNANGDLIEGLLADVMSIGQNGQADYSENHQIFLAGGTPHKLDGSPIAQLGGGPNVTRLFDEIESSHYYSLKLKNDQGENRLYVDFYEKFKTHFDIISAPAKHKFPEFELTPYVGAESHDPENPFIFDDTHAARAQINDLRDKLIDQKVAIIGTGGSGSYVLDLISKSPVGKIVLFDDDEHKVHNSFRVPGPTMREDLGRKKVDFLKSRYEHTHKHISAHAVRLTDDNVELLDGITFGFVCVDNVLARQAIAKILTDRDVPFIDVGMGLDRTENGLVGMLRATLAGPRSSDKAMATLVNEAHADSDDDYHINIQTADLNSLNAALAVVMFKKHCGYYAEMPVHWQYLFTVQSNAMVRFEV